MRLIEVNYSLQDLHLEFKNSTGEYVDNIATNLNNPYVKWLEEIAIKAKKDALTDEEIRKSIMEELAASDKEESEDCDCGECNCKSTELDSIPENFKEPFMRAVKQFASGETISKSFEELQGIGGSTTPTPDRIGFNEHNK